MMICDVFRGRLDFEYVLNSDMRTFYQLYLLAIERSNTTDGKEQMEAEATEDVLMEGML